MKRLRSVLMPILVFIIGLTIGYALSAYFGFRRMNTYMKESSFSGIGYKCALLQVLRAGDTNKVREALEEGMDADIVQFAAIKRNIPVAKLEPAVLRVIAHVRDYRAAHPYHSGDPKMDRFIASILSLTNKTMWPNTALEPTPTAR